MLAIFAYACTGRSRVSPVARPGLRHCFDGADRNTPSQSIRVLALGNPGSHRRRDPGYGTAVCCCNTDSFVVRMQSDDTSLAISGVRIDVIDAHSQHQPALMFVARVSAQRAPGRTQARSIQVAQDQEPRVRPAALPGLLADPFVVKMQSGETSLVMPGVRIDVIDAHSRHQPALMFVARVSAQRAPGRTQAAKYPGGARSRAPGAACGLTRATCYRL